MSLHRLYYDAPLSEGAYLELNSDANQYLLHVLRLKKNATFIIFNGKKGEFIAQISDIKKRSSAIIKVLKFQEGIANPSLIIHLGQTLSKAQRMDYALQKATELGVTAITPLYGDRSNVKFEASRLNNRMSHWMGVITHASAQSKRCDIPRLNLPEDFSTASLFKNEGLKFICTSSLDKSSISHFPQPTKVTLLVGPEGGFTNEEINLAKTNGFHPLSLGPRTLRTETAAVVAVSMIQMHWGDLKTE